MISENVILKVTNLRKSFGVEEVLRGVDLEVRKGEVVCIIGPSGSGKTTLLRCINQLETHDDGQIILNETPVGYEEHNGRLHVQRERDVAAVRRRVGIVFQSFNLFSHMTALSNVMYGPRKVLKQHKHEVRQRSLDLLDQVGLAHRANAYPRELSGGQQQRVAIARALAMEPELILFDEPTSALDSESVSEVLAVMRSIANRGMTMLIVTHEIEFARDVADTLVVMDHGQIVEKGPVADVFSSPTSARGIKLLRKAMAERRLEEPEQYTNH